MEYHESSLSHYIRFVVRCKFSKILKLAFKDTCKVMTVNMNTCKDNLITQLHLYYHYNPLM